jgi:predicted phage terminase large subunit-like protein
MTSEAAPTLPEVVQLGAVDPVFYARFFFPRTFRTATPPFHHAVWTALEDPAHRHLAIELFRGSGKTTLLRTFASRRIAYGLARTILFVSRSQEYASESVIWMQKQVLHNATWAGVFGLRQGVKWTAENAEIMHGVEQHPIRLIARGITGQNRGLNIEDYRPDLIVVDDPDDEETTRTEDSRRRTSDLFFGAIEKSLARRSDSPGAKIVLLQTPLHRDDLVESCMRDPQWHGLRYGCFDSRTESVWPEQFPTSELLLEKEAHIRRNQLSLWMREMECRVVTEESRDFRSEWLRFYEHPPEHMSIYMAIDPAPPLSDDSRRNGADTDYQAFAVIGLHGGNAYLLDYEQVRNQVPEETATEFFRLASKWQPRVIGVEATAYQRTLAYYLRERMRHAGRFWPIRELNEKRRKRDRIRQALQGRASAGALYVRREHTEFQAQFAEYPDCRHDDLLDAVAMALQVAGGAQGDGTALEVEYQRIAEDEKDIMELEGGRWAV